jgi:general secretion pathway protein G
MHATARNRSAFSLIELVIVVVIIGIIAAIAIPRMSRGASGANDSTLIGNLAVLRKAVDLYAAEHSGTFPTDETTIANQLTQYSDATGACVATKDNSHIFGPYITRQIPILTVGTNRGASAFTATAGTASCGWVYNKTTGVITANTTTEKDAAGVLYNTY